MFCHLTDSSSKAKIPLTDIVSEPLTTIIKE